MDLERLGVHGALERLESGAVSSVELTTAFLQRIEERNGSLNSLVSVCAEEAMAQAEAADRARAAGGELGALCGVPLVVKDMLLTRGIRTTAGSRFLGEYLPLYDATVVRRLKDAGAVILGKANQDEFAMGSSNEHSAFGPAHHPRFPSRTPGGSSGGAAAAVAGGLCCGALGTDTGGSVRQPASFTGLVGIRPTYGRVSRYGVVAYASSLDQVGPLAWTTWDAARLLEVIAGHDPADSTSASRETADYCAAASGDRQGLAGLRVGVPREFFRQGLAPDVERAVRAALASLRRAGAVPREISLPHTRYAIATYYLLATAEASSNLARYDGIRYGRAEPESASMAETYARNRSAGFGTEVKRRILLGTYALSAGYYDAYYLRAQRVRALIRDDFERAFAEVDVVVTPTAPTVAFELGQKTQDPLEMYLADIYTVSPSLAGIPGISVPCGEDPQGLPIGLQILAPWFAEDRMLQVAAGFERLREREGS